MGCCLVSAYRYEVVLTKAIPFGVFCHAKHSVQQLVGFFFTEMAGGCPKFRRVEPNSIFLIGRHRFSPWGNPIHLIILNNQLCENPRSHLLTFL